jgi:MFS family permease
MAFRVYAPSLLYSVGLGGIMPVIALSARAFGASVATAALVITLIGVGSLLTNIPASLVIARFGERAGMIGAAAWATMGMGVCLFAGHLAPYAAGILMIGMAGSVFNLARQSYLTEAVPISHRARAMSGLGGTLRIGLFIGPFVAALAMVWFDITGAYYVGLAAMVASTLVCIRIPELASRSSPPAGTGPEDDAGAASLRSIATAHWRTYLTVGVGVVLISAVRATRQAVIPLWAEHIGLDASATSLIYGLSGAVDMLVFYPAGKVMDRRGRTWVAVPCMIVMGFALAAMPFTQQSWTLLLAATVLGFGNGIGSGIVMTLGADLSPARGRPQFLGMWRLMADVGVMAGPVILSGVTAVASLAGGMWAVAALSLAGAGVFGYFIPRAVPPPGRR